jgi:glycosyltransferase involved in cell wall biosynthesis
MNDSVTQTPISTSKRLQGLLINVPHLDRPGGVREIYKILDLEKHGIGQYFFIHPKPERETAKWQVVIRLIQRYLKFYKRVGEMEMVLINPSLGWKSFLRDAMFAYITQLRGKKLVVFWHGWLEEYERKIKSSWLLRACFSRTFANADGLIVLGTIFKDKLTQLIPSNEIPTLHFLNIADDTFMKTFDLEKELDRRERKEKFTMLFLARMVKEKGVYIAVEAFRQAAREMPDRELELIIAGDGSELGNVKTYVKENQIPNIQFPGFVRGTVKHETLAKADLFLFPTYYPEGLPLSVLEAMLYGMPVITRPVGGLPDILNNEEHGYIIDSKDPADFVEPIKNLVRDRELYRRICRNNHEFATNNVINAKATQSLSNFLETI